MKMPPRPSENPAPSSTDLLNKPFLDDLHRESVRNYLARWVASYLQFAPASTSEQKEQAVQGMQRELARMMGGKPSDSLVAETLKKAGHKA